MNYSAKSNMFSVARDTVLQKYAAQVQPAATPCSFLFCVVCSQAPSEAAASALAASAQALGYAQAGCFFVICYGLDPKQLFELVEGIDPLTLVVADKDAANALGQAYRTAQGPRTLQLNRHQCVLGREAIVFSSFEAMLAKPDTKQKAWALLKKLPKLS